MTAPDDDAAGDPARRAPRRIDNPPDPWSTRHVEWLDAPPPAALEVFEEEAATILSENDSPDLPFRWSLNPYRGCFHGCAYCYARPTHGYLGFGAGTDFERRIVVKTNAPELLQQRLARPSWRGDTIVLSGVTDCYQPLEASYGLTRRCLQVCARFRQPVAIVTKGALVERDVDVLAELARHGAATVFVSIPFADEHEARAIEPFAGSPARRLRALRALSAAGVPTGVSVSPLIPGLNDHEVPRILAAARAAGATRAFHVLLRLPAEVEPVFAARLRAAFPERADKVLSLLRQMRGGRHNDARFHDRMRGEGPRYRLVADLFHLTATRLGYEQRSGTAAPSPFRRPFAQGSLFGSGPAGDR